MSGVFWKIYQYIIENTAFWKVHQFFVESTAFWKVYQFFFGTKQDGTVPEKSIDDNSQSLPDDKQRSQTVEVEKSLQNSEQSDLSIAKQEIANRSVNKMSEQSFVTKQSIGDTEQLVKEKSTLPNSENRSARSEGFSTTPKKDRPITTQAVKNVTKDSGSVNQSIGNTVQIVGHSRQATQSVTNRATGGCATQNIGNTTQRVAGNQNANQVVEKNSDGKAKSE
uniref:Uncharacterized protein n=1 Tax=Biomphalaria glabrata TaxID=6526 RepID=A0A2C9M572_BIOGL